MGRVWPQLQKTKKALDDFSRRPAVPRDPILASTAQFEPEELFLLAQEVFLKNVRNSSSVPLQVPSDK